MAEIDAAPRALAATILEAVGLALAERDALAEARFCDLRDGLEARLADALDNLPEPPAIELPDFSAEIADALASADERTDGLLAELETRFAEALENLPEPEPGERGRDGLDRVLALPRYVREGETCEANVIAWAMAGLWQSVRVTSGGPADDPSGWRCLVPGVHAIETREDWTSRELVIGLRMSDGTLHECRGRMPATQLPPDYLARGWGVLAGDTLRPPPEQPGDEIELLALKDGAALGNAEDWRETRLRGFRGQKGKPGDKGERGPPGPGLAGLGLAREGDRLALVPRYADPTIEAEPIAVDLLVDDPGPGLAPVTGYAGDWNAARTYPRGAMVSAIIGGTPRLCLSIKPDNNDAPGKGRGWQVLT